MRSRTCLLILVLSFATFARAQAPKLDDVGLVNFATSGSSEAQPYLLRGLAQLHNFEYPDAANLFRQAQKLDPSFAMAYWGEAMTYNHPLWFEQDQAAARAALGRLAPTPEARAAKAGTERERDYLHAVEILYGEGSKEERDDRYAIEMASLHAKYPADVDAAAFYALSLMGTAHKGRDIPTYMRALAILEDLFYANPNHPGVAHYLIHASDDPVHAPLGLHAARSYSNIAPAAAHAQHMTSHIFVAMGMWDDVVRANEVASDVVNRLRAASNRPPQLCGHYTFWLEYGYLQQGRVQSARTVLEGCEKQAQQASPSAGAASPDPDNFALASFAEMRARYLIDTGDWKGEIAAIPFPSGARPQIRATFAFGSGYAAVHRGDLQAARTALDQLKTARAEMKQQLADDSQERNRLGILETQLQAMISAADGSLAQAVKSLQEIAPTEEAMPFEFGPPFVEKPSYELLGELLLKSGDASAARAAFRTALQHTPERTSSLMGLSNAQKAMGDVAHKLKSDSITCGV
jgi:tetratricopeptide (TPR) repeat protein